MDKDFLIHGLSKLVDYDLFARCHQNRTISYGDASSARNDAWGFEVLAAAPDSGESLPFRPGEYKAQDFIKLRTKRPSDPEVQKIERILGTSWIYAINPAYIKAGFEATPTYENLRKVSLEQADSWVESNVIDETAKLDPDYWLDQVPTDDPGVFTFEKVPRRLVDIVREAQNLYNLKRLLLKKLHLFREVLPFRPTFTAYDSTREIKVLPQREVAIASARIAIYDEGHNDVPVLEDCRKRTYETRLFSFRTLFSLPEFVPGRVSQADSKTMPQIQVADMAAGYARHLLKRDLVAEVCSAFAYVWINGCVLKDETATLSGVHKGNIGEFQNLAR